MKADIKSKFLSLWTTVPVPIYDIPCFLFSRDVRKTDLRSFSLKVVNISLGLRLLLSESAFEYCWITWTSS